MAGLALYKKLVADNLKKTRTAPRRELQSTVKFQKSKSYFHALSSDSNTFLILALGKGEIIIVIL